MAYLVVNITRYEVISRCETERGAKISASRHQKKTKDIITAMTSSEYYSISVPKKKVINLMTGTEIEIDVNTPACCDPSRESYWSM